MLRSSIKVTAVIFFAMAFAMLSTGCGGGGLSINVTPNPGGNQNLPQSPIPAITVMAGIGPQGLFVDAAPNTFGPGAEVIMRDSNGMEVRSNAQPNGAFTHVGFPPGFNQTGGATVEVSQLINGMTESVPRSLTIV